MADDENPDAEVPPQRPLRDPRLPLRRAAREGAFLRAGATDRGGGRHRITGGAIVGRTDKAGVEVADRPVTVPDLFATFCASLGIDGTKENMSSTGRPIKLVDGGEAVRELL